MSDPHAPRPYDIDDPAELKRLIRELRGYMHVSLKHGTDWSGRRFALDALNKLADSNCEIATIKRDLPVRNLAMQEQP